MFGTVINIRQHFRISSLLWSDKLSKVIDTVQTNIFGEIFKIIRTTEEEYFLDKIRAFHIVKCKYSSETFYFRGKNQCTCTSGSICEDPCVSHRISGIENTTPFSSTPVYVPHKINSPQLRA